MSKDIKLTIIDRNDVRHEVEVPVDMHLTLMEVCKAGGLPVEGTCGGMALCSTCHVYVMSDHDLGELTPDEELMLDQAFFVDDEKSRLGCQLTISEEMDGLIVKLAPQEL